MFTKWDNCPSDCQYISVMSSQSWSTPNPGVDNYSWTSSRLRSSRPPVLGQSVAPTLGSIPPERISLVYMTSQCNLSLGNWVDSRVILTTPLLLVLLLIVRLGFSKSLFYRSDPLSNAFLTLVGISYEITSHATFGYMTIIVFNISQQTFRRPLAHLKNQTRSWLVIDVSILLKTLDYKSVWILTRFWIRNYMREVNNCSNLIFFLPP